MNTTTRTLIAIPLAAAALSAGTTTAMAQPAGPVLADLDISQPEPEPDPHPQPGPQDGPDDKDGPNPDDDPGPDGPDDKIGPAGDPGPDGPDDLDGPNPGDGDDDDDGDNDDGDSDSDDSDDDDSDDKVRRPSRVDAGATDEGLSLAWLLASGAVVTAAGGFTARRAAMKRR
ncbi:MAG TPA: hypothetical protein VJL80_13205 [Aeromicrobium sp.]|nr:hypothetical protein [Aeromicrobium sp.]HKY58992.1 hypothetical protein [Aeromicrobium sp.]